MASVELQISLPASLAEEARAGGLLDPEALAGILREELRRRSVDRMFEAADRLRASGNPPLSPDEIQAEIDAVRTARRNRK